MSYKILSVIIGILLILTPLSLFTADYNYKNGNYELANKLNPFEPRYKMKLLLYKKSLNYDEIKSFYTKNQTNPYVSKYILIWFKQHLSEKNIDMYKEMIKTAHKNYPQDTSVTALYENFIEN